MVRQIEIKNLKGIKHLDFDLPEKNGVYLLVGANGTGKTTLLTCLERICNEYAFARGFIKPKYIDGYDEFDNSSIKYIVENEYVVFRKRKSRWAASGTDKSKAVLNKYGFKDVVFIKADSKRIDANKEDIKKGKKQPADEKIVKKLNEIFDTDKYNKLQILKISHGRGKNSSYLNIMKDGKNYYTEKRFSTGEIAILRLIQEIKEIKEGSLVLLDEAEMALHPKVQVNLLNYLKEKSVDKKLMIIIATHSPTLIRTAKAEDIIFLRNDYKGALQIYNPCYPAFALGGVDYEKFCMPDYIFFVEDIMARRFLLRIVERYKKIVDKHNTANVAIVPVAGYKETAQITINTSKQFLNEVKVAAFLDTDAFDDKYIQNMKKEYKNLIYDLTITPEVKFVNVINESKIMEQIKDDMHVEIGTIINNSEYKKLRDNNMRKESKKQFDYIVNEIKNKTGNSEEITIEKIVQYVVMTYNDGDVKRIVGPVFNNTRQ